jgi:hypothetical protein
MVDARDVAAVSPRSPERATPARPTSSPAQRPVPRGSRLHPVEVVSEPITYRDVP